jgi:cytochrome c556
MNKSLSRFAVVGALSALGLTACGGGGQALDEDAPGAEAYLYRSALMEVIAHEMGIVGGMTRGDVPADEAAFKTMTANIATLAKMVPDAFMPKPAAIPDVSRAMPAIWDNADDFNMKAQAFAQAAQGVADSAQSGGVEGSKGTVQQLGQACGACHRMYREPEDE